MTVTMEYVFLVATIGALVLYNKLLLKSKKIKFEDSNHYNIFV
jgi:hypothetical protein